MSRYRQGTSLIETVKDAAGDPDHMVYVAWRGTCLDDEEQDVFHVCAECDQLMDGGCTCIRCTWCGLRIVKDLVTVDGDEAWHPACVAEAKIREEATPCPAVPHVRYPAVRLSWREEE